MRAIREQIASAINLIVHTSRIKGGRRAVTSITEVCGMNDSQILTQEIYRWNNEGGGTSGECGLVPTGIPTRFAQEDPRSWA